MIPVLLSLVAVAFGVSGLVLAIATYKAVKVRDWPAAMIGTVLTGICIICAAGLILIL